MTNEIAQVRISQDLLDRVEAIRGVVEEAVGTRINRTQLLDLVLKKALEMYEYEAGIGPDKGHRGFIDAPKD